MSRTFLSVTVSINLVSIKKFKVNCLGYPERHVSNHAMNVQIAYSIHLPTLFLLSNGDILAILLHARFHLRLQFYFLYHKYGNTGCGVFKGGFWLKINCSQMKLPNLEKWSSAQMCDLLVFSQMDSLLYLKMFAAIV